VRDRNIQVALDMLKFTNKIGAYYIGKVLKSALANAGQNREINVDNLYIKTIVVDNGPIRYWPRYRGRLHVSRIRRRWCHVSVILDDGQQKTEKAK
jgi:large subunit ribosomal protein L22